MEEAIKEKEKGCVHIKLVNKGGRPIDFLGYIFNGSSVKIRKTIKNNYIRKRKRYKNNKDKEKIIHLDASFKGWCKWGNGKNLYFKYTNKKMGFIKNGIKPKDKIDAYGKRIFDAKYISISNIVNENIVILDFENNIKTKDNNDKNKCVMLFYDSRGNLCKTITSSSEIISVLEQAKAKGNMFPQNDCIIESYSCGKYNSYRFKE